GRVVEGGKAAPGVDMTLGSLQGGGLQETKTDATGGFTVRVRVKRSTDFEVSVSPKAGPCAPSSPEAGGCVGSLTVPPDDAFATVWVSVPGGAARAIRARDQRQAERENLTLADFSSDFNTVGTSGADSCMNGRGERHVTITGESASLAFIRSAQ